MTVEQVFSLGHQLSQLLHLALGHVLYGAVNDVLVQLSKRLMLALLFLVRGKRVAAVQVTQNLHRVLFPAKVGKDPVKRFLNIKRTHLHLITVEGHEVGLHAEGTSLIETAAPTRGAQLADVGNVHLAQCVQVEII